MNESGKYEYDAILHEDPDSGGAYVIFPWDLNKEFGKGRAKVHAIVIGNMSEVDDELFE